VLLGAVGLLGVLVEEVIEGNGCFEVFGGGGEAAGVEAVAWLWVGGGEEGEGEGVWVGSARFRAFTPLIN
jgi:hypothetical protein